MKPNFVELNVFHFFMHCGFLWLNLEPKAGFHQFLKIQVPLQNSRLQKSDMKQVPCWGRTNITRHHTKFSYLGFEHPDLKLILGGIIFIYLSCVTDIKSESLTLVVVWKLSSVAVRFVFKVFPL